MADYASDPKVEDVLSSVRRLVSQEIPKRQPSKPASDGGALLLTSKDRISEEHSARVAAKTLEQRIAELEKAVDDGTEEFEPDGSEDQAQHRPDRIVFTRPRSSEISVQRTRSALRLSEIALIETGPAQEPETKPDRAVEFRHSKFTTTSEAPTTPEAPMAEDVPTLPASTAEVHAFSDPDDVVARIEARIERGGEAPVQVSQPVVQDSGQDQDFDAALTAAVRASLAADRKEAEKAEQPGDTLKLDESLAVAPEPKPSQDAAPQARVTAPEARETDIPQEPAQADARSRTPVEDTTAPVADAPPASDPTPEEMAEQALDALPDEEALRLLVARLMREELRGALGERITQNVRKLVRSEVKRVLEARSLD